MGAANFSNFFPFAAFAPFIAKNKSASINEPELVKELVYPESSEVDTAIPLSYQEEVSEAEPISPNKRIIIRMLNVFENDSGSPETEYDKIYIYADGPNDTRQVTLARGYTECGGALWKVFEYYKQLGGKNANELLSYRKETCEGTLPRNKEFLNLIIKSAKTEQIFRDAEDKVFDDLYWNKGEAYFNKNGFKQNLSLAVIQDTILHSGSFLPFLTKKFSEKLPVNGGNEKKWIAAYVEARLNWLSNASKLLQNTVYRPKFFLGEIKKGNWSFQPPIIANGSKIA